MRKLFGTDGVRGVAGELLTAELALALGAAATREIGGERPRVLVIRDPRESGSMLESALAAGIASAGGDVLLGGVLPTPAAPLLIGRYGFDLAAVISASHNPFADNGIKFFGADRFKLSDATELAIERAPASAARAGAPTRIGSISTLRGTDEDYLRALQERFADLSLAGIDVVLDCANGATYRCAPEIFRRLGATRHGARRRARRAQHQRWLRLDAHRTRSSRRCARAATTSASPSTATAIASWRSTATARSSTATSSSRWRRCTCATSDRLPGGGVVVTVMTNFGFHTAMRAAGVEVATTAVGDRYVLEELRARGWGLGGEQSGHIIDMGFVPSGDGIASALLTLEALAGRDLAERDAMDKLPQQLVNVRVADRDAAMAERGAARGHGARGGGAGGPRPRARAPVGHRAARPRHGRGADRGGDRRGLRVGSWRSSRPDPTRRESAAHVRLTG